MRLKRTFDVSGTSSNVLQYENGGEKVYQRSTDYIYSSSSRYTGDFAV